MVNFLETNKRLPKNIDEVKKSSRFSSKCGSRELITGISENFIRGIIASVFAVLYIAIESHFSSYSTTNETVPILIYYFVRFLVKKAITKYNAFKFIINHIEKVLINIVQCANTTSKVKNKDIFLAYCSARSWLQFVYPQFYNENEDIFWKQYFKVNN